MDLFFDLDCVLCFFLVFEHAIFKSVFCCFAQREDFFKSGENAR